MTTEDSSGRPADTPTGPLGSRLAGLIVAGPCLAMLIIGLTLEPRNAGYGTAELLQMPACSKLTSSGYPCPTCGMTTSVALSVRGRLVSAWDAHPFGPVLTGAAIVLAIGGLLQAATRLQVLHWLRFGWWWLLGALVCTIVGWQLMLRAGVASGKWPIG